MAKLEPAYSVKSETPCEEKKESKDHSKKNYTINVRSISNGWIVRECYDQNGKYHEVERYEEENPLK